MINPLNVVAARLGASPSTVGPTQPSAAISNDPVDSFGSIFKSMMRDAAATIQSGEANAIAGMQGKVPLQKVVETVVQAEQTLHTAVAIRDKVVSAYLEISRMQI